MTGMKDMFEAFALTLNALCEHARTHGGSRKYNLISRLTKKVHCNLISHHKSESSEKNNNTSQILLLGVLSLGFGAVDSVGIVPQQPLGLSVFLLPALHDAPL